MKIIVEGNKHRKKCRECGAVLEYEKDDVKEVRLHINEYHKHIVCPCCENKIIVM